MKLRLQSRPLRLTMLASLTAAIGALAALGHAQQARPANLSGMDSALDEAEAWEAVRDRRYIKARELGEAIVRERPDSYVGHFVLGHVHHYGEANFAKALYHERRAMTLYTNEHGREPGPDAPWRWHARMLRELAGTHGDLEHYDEQLAMMLRYSERYQPHFIAERAWPLMKLRRFDDAREAAQLGLSADEPRQHEIALNALCAIEYEAGDEMASYRACREAMEAGAPGTQSAVDFTNFAEAARSVFRLDEAEQVGRQATEAQVAWYGNPWVELGELYIREARVAEALDALRRAPEYRQQRPPHVRESDRNEGRRALASFFLLTARADDAVRISSLALNAPDRRAHNSRDPAQDRAIAGLISRASLRLRAARTREAAVGRGFWANVGATFSALADEWSGWLAGRTAARTLSDPETLVGTFEIGSHRSAVMPPWLVGELVDVMGAGVVRESVRLARAEDERPGADAYYDAFEAEATLAAGDAALARTLAQRSIDGLAPAEAMLIARMHALLAESARREGDRSSATASYGEAFQRDPGVFRRMGWTVPASFTSAGGLSEDVADAIASGPRFSESDWGLRVDVRGDRAGLTACLLDGGGSQLSCAEIEPDAAGEDEAEFVARAVAELHEVAFAPRVDLSQGDANGLDGSNRVSRNPLETLMGGSGDLPLD